MRPGFQGGQLPLAQSLPKIRGFTNIFREQYSIVNLSELARFPANAEVTPQLLVATGILKNLSRRIKVLARGELENPLAVAAHAFSRSAREKIEAAGGSARQVG